MARAKEKPTILIAEDEEINRTILREILKEKYRVLEAENGQQAVFFLKAEETTVSLIILDIHMPKLDGFGVMDYLNDTGLNEKIPVIITTADESPDILVQGKKNKVVDIVYKPFRAADIIKTVDTLVNIVDIEHNLEAIIADKSSYLTLQYDAVRKAKTFHHSRWDDNIKTLIGQLLPGSLMHCERIQAYSLFMCEKIIEKYPQYGLSKSMVKSLVDASLMHDLGKVVIPDSLLDKNDPSAPRAIAQFRRRPIAGSELINMMFANSGHQVERKYAYEICRCMHETFDGKGYPIGLNGQEIPISAQIVGLVHRYDELRFDEEGTVTPHKSVVKKILESEYKAFNPDFLEIFEDYEADFERISEAEYKGE